MFFKNHVDAEHLGYTSYGGMHHPLNRAPNSHLDDISRVSSGINALAFLSSNNFAIERLVAHECFHLSESYLYHEIKNIVSPFFYMLTIFKNYYYLVVVVLSHLLPVSVSMFDYGTKTVSQES